MSLNIFSVLPLPTYYRPKRKKKEEERWGKMGVFLGRKTASPPFLLLPRYANQVFPPLLSELGKLMQAVLLSFKFLDYVRRYKVE